MKRGQEILNKEQDILACLDSTLETSDEEIPATPQVPRRGGIGGRGGRGGSAGRGGRGRSTAAANRVVDPPVEQLCQTPRRPRTRIQFD